MTHSPLALAIQYATAPKIRQGHPRGGIKTYGDARDRMLFATMDLGAVTGLAPAYALLGMKGLPPDVIEEFRTASKLALCMAQGCHAAAIDNVPFDQTAPDQSFQDVLPAGVALTDLVQGLYGVDEFLSRVSRLRTQSLR